MMKALRRKPLITAPICPNCGDLDSPRIWSVSRIACSVWREDGIIEGEPYSSTDDEKHWEGDAENVFLDCTKCKHQWKEPRREEIKPPEVVLDYSI
jgi:Zn ribbon nucleic-acid-binding protein